MVITSPNGADEIARRGRNLLHVAAVGPGTAEALRARGITPDVRRARVLAGRASARVPRPAGRVLFAAAEGARRGPIDELGADFVPCPGHDFCRPCRPKSDLVVLASGLHGTSVRSGRRRRARGDDRARTSKAASAPGLTVRAEAASHDLDGWSPPCAACYDTPEQ